MIEGFEERHGLNILHSWGMTELCPLGTVGAMPQRLASGPKEDKYAYKSKQGRPCPLVEIRARNENGEVPWDGQSMGELEVRGPWIASGYYHRPDAQTSFTEDGWFRTGDIVAIDKYGTLHLQDRAKDVIKSGGEWISSVALENALMGHPAVAEAAVIPALHPKWAERPLAIVVLKKEQAGHAERAARLHQAAVRQVVAARRDRVCQRNSAHLRRQVYEDRAAREVWRLLRSTRERRVRQFDGGGGIVLVQKIRLVDALAEFDEHWSPRIVGELNGQHVKLVKLAGEFVWHHHADEDEMFLVLYGILKMEYRVESGEERTIDVGEGEFVIVPRGVEHRPTATEEVHVLLFEPAGTLNTGNVRNELTVDQPTRLVAG